MNKVNIRSLFYKNAAWNTLDALGSQGLVVLLHIFLRMYMGPVLHGIIGMLFSFLYMAILLGNCGFDFSCAPFMSFYTADKKNFHYFVHAKLNPQMYLIASFAIVSFIIGVTVGKLSDLVALTLALLFFIESIKKTLRVLLQLLFYTPYTALIEFGGMVVYCALITLWYLAGYQLTVLSVFGCLVPVSLLQVALLSGYLYRWYRTAPETSLVKRPAQLNQRVAFSRLWISLQRIIEQVFSNNFLVPFFAFSCGITYASYFKIASSVARWVSLFGEKTFGMTSLMLFSQITENTGSERQEIVHFVNKSLLIVVGLLLVVIVGAGNYIGYYYCPANAYSFFLICTALIALRLVDILCIVYERLFLIEEKSLYTCILSGVLALCVYIGISVLTLSPLHVILFLIIMRGLQLVLSNWYILYKR